MNESIKCPKCTAAMHTNKVISFDGKPWKQYQQCPKCNYKSKAK